MSFRSFVDSQMSETKQEEDGTWSFVDNNEEISAVPSESKNESKHSINSSESANSNGNESETAIEKSPSSSSINKLSDLDETSSPRKKESSKKSVVSLPLFPNSAREGYLKKKGQRRYFVLTTESELLWYKELKADQPRGKIESLVNYQIFIYGDMISATEFKIIPEPGRSGQSLVLGASSNELMKEWIVSLRKAVKPNTSNGVLAKVPAKSGYLIKEGHIVKNKKKRWFLLPTNSKTLCYYKIKDSPKPTGIISLEDATYSLDPTDSKCFVVNTKENGKIFFLEADSEEERGQWIEALVARSVTLIAPEKINKEEKKKNSNEKKNVNELV